MREDQMRRVLLEVRRELDLGDATRRSVVPASVGSLMAGACGVPVYGSPGPPIATGGNAADGGNSGGRQSLADAESPIDSPVVKYTAPDAGS